MCTSTPKAPAPVAARQAARMPDTADLTRQNDDAQRRRASLASMTFTTPALAPAETAGTGAKITLGQ